MLSQWLEGRKMEARPNPRTLAARSMAKKLVQSHLYKHKTEKKSRQSWHHLMARKASELKNKNTRARTNTTPTISSATSGNSISSSSDCSSDFGLTDDDMNTISLPEVKGGACRSNSCFFVPAYESDVYLESEVDEVYSDEDSISDESDDSDSSFSQEDRSFYEDSNGYRKGKHAIGLLKKGFLLKKKAIMRTRKESIPLDSGDDTVVSNRFDTGKKASFSNALTGAFKTITGAMFNCNLATDFKEETIVVQSERVFDSFDKGFLLSSKDRKASTHTNKVKVVPNNSTVNEEMARVNLRGDLISTGVDETKESSVSTMIGTLWESIPASTQLQESDIIKKSLSSSIYGTLFKKHSPVKESTYSYGKDYRFTVDISGTEEVVFYANGKFHSFVEEQFSFQHVLLYTKYEGAYFRFLVYVYTILERIGVNTKWVMDRRVVPYKSREIAGFYDLARDKVLIHLLTNIIYAYEIVKERIQHLHLAMKRRTQCEELTFISQDQWRYSRIINTFTLSHLGNRVFWGLVLFQIVCEIVQTKERHEIDFKQKRQIVPFDVRSEIVRPEVISWAQKIMNLIINVGLAFTMIELSPNCIKQYSAWWGRESLIWDEYIYDFARSWAMSSQIRNKHICRRLRVTFSKKGYQLPKTLKIDCLTVPIVYDKKNLCPPAPTKEKPSTKSSGSSKAPVKSIDPILLFTKAVYMKEWDKSTYIRETAPCVKRVEKDNSWLSINREASLWANTGLPPNPHSGERIGGRVVDFQNIHKSYKARSEASLLSKTKKGVRGGYVLYFWASKYGKRTTTL